MSLYDIIDEISEKQVLKSDTGDNRIFGVMVGTVAKNYDQNMPGRICVAIPTRDKDADELKWARLAMPSSGTSWGHYFLPEVTDQVLLAFEGGNIEKPYVIGSIPKDKNKFLKQAVDKDNKFKKIITKNGTSIVFTDEPQGDGEKDKISITTATGAHVFSMDNENSEIKLTDKDKANSIIMSTKDGNIDIKAKSKLTIKVGDTITVTLNGDSGAVTIKASDFKLETSGKIAMKSDMSFSAESAQASVKASSSMKVESSGVCQVKGSSVMIG